MALFLNPRFFLFVAATLVVHWCVTRSNKARTHVLWIASVGFLAYLHPLFAALAVLAATLVHSLCGRGRGRALAWLVFAGFAGLALANLLPSLAARMPGGTWFEKRWLAPLGASYLVFRMIQYAADRYRGTITDASWSQFMAFLFFFPALPAGPLTTFQQFKQHRRPTLEAADVAVALKRILRGYFKKLFLVGWAFEYWMGDFAAGFLAHPALEIARASSASPLAFVALMFVYAFLDLSAYTDIAVGLGALFGIRLPENFDRPFLKSNLGDFWRSWHISLSQWCRNQVFFPVFGLTRRPWLATYASMLVLGLWHQISWNWVAWAGWHASGLVVHSRWRRARPQPAPSPVARAFATAATLVFVSLGYAFVATKDLPSALALLGACLIPFAPGGLG
jgi:alginate O-acetyltransferase complex protein AlgI